MCNYEPVWCTKNRGEQLDYKGERPSKRFAEDMLASFHFSPHLSFECGHAVSVVIPNVTVLILNLLCIIVCSNLGVHSLCFNHATLVCICLGMFLFNKIN